MGDLSWNLHFVIYTKRTVKTYELVFTYIIFVSTTRYTYGKYKKDYYSSGKLDSTHVIFEIISSLI